VGNRPQFIKAAAVSGPLREQHEEILVHTGQHHDDTLSAVFFSELGIARPDRELGISGASNTSQTSRMLAALEPLLSEVAPDATLVYGDTNSTLAGALASAQAQVPVIHIEAGMRSYDRAMPEELSRVLTDHMSGLLLCSSETAAQNLRDESAVGRIEVVGDVMVDVARRWGSHEGAGEQAAERILDMFALTAGAYYLLTAHRAENVHLTEPLGYVEFSALLWQARAVLTDSGGVQKEAYLAKVPCVTLRANTEWVETVAAGWNTLVDLDLGAAKRALALTPPAEHPELYGDGHAAERCVAAIGEL
jgi:UDP-N-acetylglucosamine 2-epimerase (non-hydrolysing)/UDP-GlcNAc3NAcA epimerase